MNDGDIVSGFGRYLDVESTIGVDFSKAKRIERSGSTCDTFESTLQRRHVFIKRLKPQFRHNPLYLAAFDKEFEVGVTLTHPSLPRYVAIGDDYIVMDYVEGETLAGLLSSGGSVSLDYAKSRKILGELIDVVEYLHNRGVIHCDIKADNVIVSPYPDRPITLVDFDKAYTAALNTTHGDPRKYECQDCKDGGIDFRGIGRIAEQLGQRRFSRLCDVPGVAAERLRRALRRRVRPLRWIALTAATIVTAVAVSVLFWGTGDSGQSVDVLSQQDSVAGIMEPADMEPTTEENRPALAEGGKEEEVTAGAAAAPKIDLDWIESMVKPKALALERRRERLAVLMDSDSLPEFELSDSIHAYLLESAILKSRFIFAAVEHFHDFPEIDVQHAVRTNGEYLKLVAEDRRLNEWMIKRFNQ